MPEIPIRPPTRAKRLKTWLDGLQDYFGYSGPAAALSVALVAILLFALRVEFSYVAGAFLIVFASRLSQKRLYPEVKIEEAPRRSTPARDLFDGPKPTIGL